MKKWKNKNVKQTWEGFLSLGHTKTIKEQIMRTKKWTPEKIRKLKTEAKKKTVEQLAKKYNVKTNSMQVFLSNHNIHAYNKTRWTPEKTKQLRKMKKMKVATIAKVLRVSVATVYNKMRELHIKHVDARTTR